MMYSAIKELCSFLGVTESVSDGLSSSLSTAKINRTDNKTWYLLFRSLSSKRLVKCFAKITIFKVILSSTGVIPPKYN